MGGFEPWLDEKELLPGQEWQGKIRTAVRACDVVLVCLSKNSITKDGYFQKEIKVALDAEEEKPEGTIFIIPARLEDGVEIPSRLAPWHWVNLFHDGGYERLALALEDRAKSLGASVTPLSGAKIGWRYKKYWHIMAIMTLAMVVAVAIAVGRSKRTIKENPLTGQTSTQKTSDQVASTPSEIPSAVTWSAHSQRLFTGGTVASSRPQVNILSPNNGTTSNDKVVLKADIYDKVGIKSVELVLNGGFDNSHRVSLSSAGETVAGRHSLEVEREVRLEPGTNILTVRVENIAGVIEEVSRIVKMPAAALMPIALSFSKRWALVVGVSQHQDPKIPGFTFSDRDAQSFSDTLSTNAMGGFAAEHKLVLINEQATTTGITRALRSFLQKPDIDDIVVIYLSGMGSPDPERRDNAYLITYDTHVSDIAGTALPMREIEASLRDNCKARRVIVLIDACYSEAIGTGGHTGWPSSDSVNRSLDEMVKRVKPGTAIFASARSGEASVEGRIWGGGHGVFTWFLLQGLRGDADLNHDGVISLEELFSYVRKHVRQATNDYQHPVVVSSSYDPQQPMAVLPSR
jgi:hypothetical protein